MLKKVLAILLLSVTYSNNLFADNKIFYIDLDYILQNSNVGKKILKDLNETSKSDISELKKLQSELQKQEETLQNKKNIISQEDLNNELAILREKIASYRKLKDQKATKFKDLRNEKISIFFENINPIIQNYMDINEIEILLDRKNVFIGKVTSDITNDIIKLIDKN